MTVGVVTVQLQLGHFVEPAQTHVCQGQVVVGDRHRPIQAQHLPVPGLGLLEIAAALGARVEGLASEELCGFIFKSKSPSSGMERVKVFTDKGQPVKKGRGIFAGMFMDRFPRIPVEEDGRLNDPKLRENFIEQVFTLKRWRETRARRSCVGNVVDFHSRNKLLLMAHSPKHYTEMGRLVVKAGKRDWDELTAEYGAMLMEGLAVMGRKRSGRGQARQCTPALDGFPEEPPLQRGQGLPKVGWSSWASSRTTGRDLCP